MTTASDSNLFFSSRSETVLAVALLAVLLVLLIPLPPLLLDLLLAANLGLTILLLLITLSASQPLDLSVFPSLLLLMTLYRLSLNVATTRLILLNGDAGRIVSTFGGFVVGGNLVVGLVIFLILVIIQFIVITKGAGRVSEVSARFTLDAMPGKQMAIDADLSAGIINEETAKQRREHLTREAEFYGAMDGASKFVRGDAIAGLIITAVNLVGGIGLGLSKGLSIGEAAHRYSILTVGDGLVSQIPALMIAVTAGILVTKAASAVSLGQEIGGQLLANHRPLWLGAGILCMVALTPGLPKLPFLLLAGGLWLFLRRSRKHREEDRAEHSEPPPPAPRPEQEHVEEFLQTERASLEIGAALIPLVDSKKSKSLVDRVSGLRRDLTRKYGLWVPSIRIRDNMQLKQETYRILIGGREVARNRLRPNYMLAIDPGNTRLSVDGEETREPAFGLPARWISPSVRQRAELAGYTVVDAASVLITHLGEVLRRYAPELLSRDDLQRLLDKLKEVSPAVVEELKPEVLRVGLLHQILLLLLAERVPITDLGRIVEAAVNHAVGTKDPVELANRVREALGRAICDRFRDENGKVRVMVLDPRVELAFGEALRGQDLTLPPDQLEKLITVLSQQTRKAALQNAEVAVLTDSRLRRPLRRAVERALPDLAVIAYAEIPSDLMIEPVAMIRREDILPNEAPAERSGADPASSTGDIDAMLRELSAV